MKIYCVKHIMIKRLTPLQTNAHLSFILSFSSLRMAIRASQETQSVGHPPRVAYVLLDTNAVPCG